MDRMNDRAMVGIDLIVAIVLVLAAVLMALQIMPSMSHEDRDWRIKQYMATTRATDNLVQDPGDPGWEGNWSTGVVTKIGLVYVDNNNTAMMKVLNLSKIHALMGDGYPNINNSRWWEFPNSSVNETERNTVARSLGLEGYSFYMQLHPIGLVGFNSIPLINNLTDRSNVSINEFTVTVVDRYVYIKNESSPCVYICYDNNNNNKPVHYRLNLWVW